MRRPPLLRLSLAFLLGAVCLCLILPVSVLLFVHRPEAPRSQLPGAPGAGGPQSPLALTKEIEAAATQSHLPPELIRAVIMAESEGKPSAVSRTGAQGLMQLEPATARDLGVRDPFDPLENVLGGSRYLRQLLTQYEQSHALCQRAPGRADSDSGVGPCPSPLIEALAAYNAGPNAIAQYGGVPPYPETRRYVEQVLAWFAAYSGSRPLRSGG